MSRIRGDLLDRTFDFACRILDLASEFPNDPRGWVVGKQLIRSGTSIGANVCEAHNAITDSDFAHKCSVARKESAETNYWLRLSMAARLLGAVNAASLADESLELTKILSTIVLKTQQNTKRP